MINTLLSYDHLRSNPKRRARVQIAIIFRKRAGTDRNPNAVSCFEDLASVPTIIQNTIGTPQLD